MTTHAHRIASIIAGLTSCQAALASSVSLNFGNTSNPTFGTTGNLVQPFAAVAPGVNATLVAAAPFTSLNPSNNGSLFGDIRVNATNGSSVNLKLSLWDASAGTGYNVAYSPGGTYDVTFGFFDIDGGAGTYDVVTVNTPGTYTVTATTTLLITTSPTAISFSGAASAEIPGQNGIVTLTAAQADVTALYKVTNLSVIDFNYSIGISGTPAATGRNLLLDGNDLTGALDQYSPVTETFVPEPTTAFALAAAAAALGTKRKRDRPLAAS